MAIPTTQKECTTRRIASLIIGLWGKVKNAFLLKTSRGAANGVASLDANGKVPTSQLPTVPTGNLPVNSSSSAGIVASGSGQTYQVWKTDANGVPAWRNQCFVPELEINYYTAKSRLLYTITFSSAPQWPGCSFLISIRHSFGGATGLYRLDVRCNEYDSAPTVFRLYTVLPGSSSLPDQIKMYSKYDSTNKIAYIYATIGEYCVFKMTPIYTSDYGMISYSNTDVTIPEDANRITGKGYMLLAKPTGSASVPVYIDSYGEVIPCTNVPVIEHVTTIPVNPTVGTIYAL